MSRIILPSFSTDLAHTLLDSIQLQRSQFYYFLGRTHPWGLIDREPEQNIILSHVADQEIRSNMVFMKKIEKNNVQLVTTRYDWTQNTVIPQWDNTISMVDTGYYVVTDEDKVYSCLDNAQNSISTVKPRSEQFSSHKTADGYTWKYLYTIPAFKKKNFMTTQYMPVQNALQNAFYSNGALETAVVRNPGSGYFNSPLVLLSVIGDTTGVGASLEFTVDSLGTITQITVIYGGVDYTNGCLIEVQTSTGVGAIISPIIEAGVLTDVTIHSGGFGYQTSDTAIVQVGGAVLVPRIRQSDGQFDQVSILNPGAGYTSTPTIVINYTSGTPGASSGKYDSNPSAILEAVMDGGSVVDVLLRDPGLNYPVDSETVLSVQGDGEGALLTPVIFNGEIVDVIVDDPGIGYNTAIVNVIGPGAGAVIDVIISDSNFQSNQQVIEQTAIFGGLHQIKVTEPGMGYTSNTTVTITGDGVGCTAQVLIGLGGSIARVVIDNPGLNYSFATVTFTDATRSNIFGALTGAAAYAIMAPAGGHGSDIVSQLRGTTVAINTPLRNEIEAQSLGQEFRQFGIIKDPRIKQTNVLFRSQRDSLIYKVVLTDTADISLDEILVKNDAEFRVIKVETIQNVVYLQQVTNNNTQPTGLMYSLDGTRSYNAVQLLQSPTVDKYTGKLLYISNENPFSFNENQGIVIRTFLDL